MLKGMRVGKMQKLAKGEVGRCGNPAGDPTVCFRGVRQNGCEGPLGSGCLIRVAARPRSKTVPENKEGMGRYLPRKEKERPRLG